MAIVELQLRKAVFLDFFKAEINGKRLPFPTLDFFAYPQLKGHLLERIECLNCSADATAGDGQVTVQADLAIHYHTSLATIRAAGSLNPPVTEQLLVTLPIVVSIQFVTPPGGARQPQLQWLAPLGIFPPGLIPVGLPAQINIQSGAVEASDEVVAIRLGTRSDDPVSAPITNRVGANDWLQVITGQLLADQLAANFASTLKSALTGDLVLDNGPDGTWVTNAGTLPWKAPFAMATAGITAVHQCIFDIDISVDLSLISEFDLSGDVLVTTLTLSWKVDSTLCDLVGALLFTPIGGIAIDVFARDKGSDEILGTASDPDRFHKIGETDTSIIYQSTSFIDTPSPLFALTQSEVTADGLVSGGTLTIPAPPRGLEGEASSPQSGLDIDCSKRSVSVALRPAEVSLRDIGMDGPPKLFLPGVLFDPPNAWVAVEASSNTWLDLRLTFVDPPSGRLPIGTATSVYMDTDCGARWADLGVIPPDHAPPTKSDVAHMISQCMALTNLWDLFHLDWIVDPPDLVREIDPVRQWVIAFRNLPGAVNLELVAKGARGTERIIGSLKGLQNVSAQITTDKDETLEIRANSKISAPAPTVFQRWIVPFASVHLEAVPAMVASSGKIIGIRARNGKTQIFKVGPNGTVSPDSAKRQIRSDPVLARLFDALIRETKRNRDIWAVAANLDQNTVAVVHRQALLVGTLGPMTRM